MQSHNKQYRKKDNENTFVHMYFIFFNSSIL